MTVEIKTCRNKDTYETCEFVVIGEKYDQAYSDFLENCYDGFEIVDNDFLTICFLNYQGKWRTVDTGEVLLKDKLGFRCMDVRYFDVVTPTVRACHPTPSNLDPLRHSRSIQNAWSSMVLSCSAATELNVWSSGLNFRISRMMRPLLVPFLLVLAKDSFSCIRPFRQGAHTLVTRTHPLT